MVSVRLPDGSERQFDGPVTVAQVAASIGTNTDVVAVISTTRTIPVTGARTVAAKNADIPTIAIGMASDAWFPGQTASTQPENNTPHSVPTASSGANNPPGTAAA